MRGAGCGMRGTGCGMRDAGESRITDHLTRITNHESSPSDHESRISNPADDGLRPSEFWALRDISFELRRSVSEGGRAKAAGGVWGKS